MPARTETRNLDALLGCEDGLFVQRAQATAPAFVDTLDMTRFGPVAQDLFGKKRIAFALLMECGVECRFGRAFQLNLRPASRPLRGPVVQAAGSSTRASGSAQRLVEDRLDLAHDLERRPPFIEHGAGSVAQGSADRGKRRQAMTRW